MELLVRIVNKEKSGDPALDSQRTEAGDVIAFAPDGHRWGSEEVKNPEWRIVRVPGLSLREAQALVAPELPTSFQPSRVLRKRQMKLDVDFLDETTGGAILADRASAQPGAHYDALLGAQALAEARSLKAPLRDPRLIGGPFGRIG